MDLFSEEKTILQLPDAELIYIPNFLNQNKANYYFETIRSNTKWQQDDITIFGKTYKQPRLTALYAENKASYSYSNITMYPTLFTPELLKLKEDIEKEVQHKFTTVLINLYRDGNDSNGWHADNEKELGTNPVIASLSLGEARWFHFKHRHIKEERHKILLEHGSFLIMKNTMQHYWLHQVAKTKKKIGERINLTFRNISMK
jgi:alkylated DNA repair dioxygenase AlkB